MSRHVGNVVRHRPSLSLLETPHEPQPPIYTLKAGGFKPHQVKVIRYVLN
jgi:hypothetical protein